MDALKIVFELGLLDGSDLWNLYLTSVELNRQIKEFLEYKIVEFINWHPEPRLIETLKNNLARDYKILLYVGDYWYASIRITDTTLMDISPYHAKYYGNRVAHFIHSFNSNYSDCPDIFKILSGGSHSRIYDLKKILNNYF